MNSFIGQQDLPRGLRNNNPGDIRVGDDWQGMIGSDEKGFIIFDDIGWGIRALATDLTNKIKKGENTIREIVNIYAPASENDVPKYISAVSADTGIDPDQVIVLDLPTLHSLVRAFMNHEIGDGYSAMISDSDIDQGIAMMTSQLLTFIRAVGIVAKNNESWLIPAAIAGTVLWFITRKN